MRRLKMADTLTPAQRSRCMAAIRGKNTKPELRVRSIIHSLGFRFRLHIATLPGKPDIVFASRRSVIFVHGCYWHCHHCKRGRSVPVTRREFWTAKRQANKDRDRKHRRALKKSGWRVLVIWECEIGDFEHLKQRLLHFLNES